ncbi:MAG TPA: VTT domain-containing protein [Pyrinomonadaceae bacterium]|nr:VTT domain-containing protein [Pyrinomonadaceae bacterium]
MSKQSPAKRLSALWFWIFLGAIVLLVTLLLYSAAFKNFIDKATEWAQIVMNAHPVMGALVFFLFAAISAMVAFTSSVVLVPPAILVWGKLISFLLLWGGWIAGAMAAFGIGNVARPLLVRLGYQERLDEYQQFVSKRMKFWTVVLFCIAVPSEIPGYLFGGLRYPFLKFLGAIAIAEAIYAFGIVIAGQNLTAARPFPLLLIVVTLIIIAAGARFLLGRLKKRKSERMPSG